MIRTAVFLSLAASVLAAPAFASGDKAPMASAQRVVMECRQDDATRRAFTREHGAAPMFVTADEVLAATRAGQSWSAPRCMTGREHVLLQRALREARGAGS